MKPEYYRNDGSRTTGIKAKRLEWGIIQRIRSVNDRGSEPDCGTAWSRKLNGLALSGGGIRAATFHLGLLQALAEARMLRYFDYLSAVSGGAFIAGWFCKLIYTQARECPERNALNQIERILKPRQGHECTAVHRLRQHLTYLTPHGGPLSQSTWLLGATYFHNLLISLCILTLTMVVLMIAARAALSFPQLLISGGFSNIVVSAVTEAAGAVVFACLFLLVAYLIRHRIGSRKMQNRRRLPILSIAASVVVILFFSVDLQVYGVFPHLLGITVTAFVLSAGIFSYWTVLKISDRAQRRFLAILSLAGLFILITGLYHAGSAVECAPSEKSHAGVILNLLPLGQEKSPFGLANNWWARTVALSSKVLMALGVGQETRLMLAPSIVLAVSLLMFGGSRLLLSTRWLSKLWRLEGTAFLDYAKFLAATLLIIAFNKIAVPSAAAVVSGMCVFYDRPSWLLPLLMAYVAPVSAALIVLSFNLMIAILGRVLSPYIRHHMTDISTIVYRYAFIWSSSLTIALYGPVVLSRISRGALLLCLTSWIVSIVLGFILRGDALRKNTLTRLAQRAVAGCAPYVFLCGYLLFVSFVTSSYIFGISWAAQGHEYWDHVAATLHPSSVMLLALACALLFVLSVRFGVNSPSMHLFYQSRLADAYLRETLPGGEVGTDQENAKDRKLRIRRGGGLAESPVMLHSLTPLQTPAYNGPYLLLNCSLNLQSNDEPAWQDRRAANFVLSPLFCGYEPSRRSRRRGLPSDAYSPTVNYHYSGESGLRLAQAMSISGSAIGSNMGYHTSPRIRFFHTLFNLRLGWWFPNPRDTRSWIGKMPKSRVALLMSELLGTTNDRGPYVHLSDGGHFENTGLYELIRRQCRVILVSDASEDREHSNRALGTAIERCRTDLGVEIEIQPSGDIRHAEARYTMSQPVTRCLIHYGDTKKGELIYIHPFVTGNEPIDIRSYEALHDRFPHESTANQWFKESQFESYRRLGLHVGRIVCRSLALT